MVEFLQTILPDNALAIQVLEWLVLAVATLGLLALGLFALALAVGGLDKLRFEWTYLRDRPEVGGTLSRGLDLVQGLPDMLKPFIDEPDDLAILLLARLVKRDPASLVTRLEQWVGIVGQLGLVLPEIRDLLGLDATPGAELPPKPAEEQPA